MKYTFKVDKGMREAMYAGACHTVIYRGDNQLGTLMNLTRDDAPEITLTDVQIAAILSGLEGAIAQQSTDMGDWTRAQDYMKARDILIAETRKQFRAIK